LVVALCFFVASFSSLSLVGAAGRCASLWRLRGVGALCHGFRVLSTVSFWF